MGWETNVNIWIKQNLLKNLCKLYKSATKLVPSLSCHSTWKFMVFVHAKIEDLKVKDLSQKLQGISGFIFYLQLCEGQQLKHQILLKSPTEWEHSHHSQILTFKTCHWQIDLSVPIIEPHQDIYPHRMHKPEFKMESTTFCFMCRSSKQRWITAMFPSDPKAAIEQTNENDGV